MSGQHTSATSIPAADLKLPHGAAEATIRAEQIRLLYGTPYVWLVNLITGPLATWLLWPIYPAWACLGWNALLAAIIFARSLLWQRHLHAENAARDAERWGRAFALGTFATGCLWGLLAATVFLTDSPGYTVFVVFVLGGMTAGAAMRDSAYLPAFYAFTIPAILPIIIAFLIHSGFAFNAMAALLAAFTAVLVMMGRANNAQIVDNIRLRRDERTLIADLEEMGTNLKRQMREREEVTAALQESHERLRGIGENAQDAIITTDAQGNILYWNPAAERIFGYRADEVAGRGVHTLLIPERNRQKAIDGFDRFAATGRGPIVGRLVRIAALRKDGSEFPAELSVSAMRIGGEWQAVGIARDVTEREAAEAALRRREADLKEAQRLAHVGSWMRDVKHGTLKWSEELYRIFHIAPGTKPPRFDDLPQIEDTTIRERFRAMLVACLSDGTPFAIDMAARRPDTSKMWITVQGEAVRDSAGNTTALRGTVQDITERKTAEQDIARLNEQLAEHVETLKRHDQQQQAIARMSDLLQACHLRSESFPIIAATARTLFPKASGALALIAPDTRHLETVAQWGDKQMMLENFSFDDCWALRTGQPYERAGADQRTPCHHFHAVPEGPSICLPLTAQGETSGLLHMNCAAGATLDDEKQNLMTSFANVVKLSLSNLKMREILSEQAVHDQLTTLFNRHYLVKTLPREVRRAERNKVPLAIAMLDIDHFKKFNDVHGHDAGDIVLKAVGELLRSSMRGGDIACRYGGEEFLLVMPECNRDDARALTEDICARAKRLSLSTRSKSLPSPTLSAGVAELGGDVQSADALISAADRALYAAKANGRDRVEVYSVALKAPARASAP